MLAQSDRGQSMAARQAESCLRVNAEKIRGFDGCQEWLPDTLDLNFVRRFCFVHGLILDLVDC
jgi:hypothetical protein